MITFKLIFNDSEKLNTFINSIPNDTLFKTSFDFKEIYIYSKMDFYIFVISNAEFEPIVLKNDKLNTYQDLYLENYILNLKKFNDIISFTEQYYSSFSTLFKNDFAEIHYFNQLKKLFEKSFDNESINFIIRYNLFQRLLFEDIISIIFKNSHLENIDLLLIKIKNKNIENQHIKLFGILIKNNHFTLLSKYIQYKNDKKDVYDLLYLLDFYEEKNFQFFKILIDFFISNYSFNKIQYRRIVSDVMYIFFKDEKIYNYCKNFLFNNSFFGIFHALIFSGKIRKFNNFHLDYFINNYQNQTLFFEYKINEIYNDLDIEYIKKMTTVHSDLIFEPIVYARLEKDNIENNLNDF